MTDASSQPLHDLLLLPPEQVAEMLLTARDRIAELEGSLEEAWSGKHEISFCCDCGYMFLPHGKGGSKHDCPTPDTLEFLGKEHPKTAKYWRFCRYRRDLRAHDAEATRLFLQQPSGDQLHDWWERERLWTAEHARLEQERVAIEALP